MDLSDAAAVAKEALPDLDLISRARRGDSDAFGLLVNARLGGMLRTAKAILGNDDDATEAVQETFLSAWVHLPSLRNADRFDAWLSRALVNRCRDALRKRGRSREIALTDEDLEGSGMSTPAPSLSGIREAFERLTVENRHILLLHHLHELPLTEVSRQLGIPIGTAKSRLWAARRALERALENER